MTLGRIMSILKRSSQIPNNLQGLRADDDEIALAQSIRYCARVHELPEELFTEAFAKGGSIQDIIETLRHESQLSECIRGPGEIAFSKAPCTKKTSRVVSPSGQPALRASESRRVCFEMETSDNLRRSPHTPIRGAESRSSTFPDTSA